MKKKIPVEKGQEIEIKIDALGTSGEGVGRYEGFTVFSPGALPREIVRARIVMVKKSYATAKLLTIKKESPYRVKPKCPVFPRCGGCQLQHMNYEGQLAAKRQQVIDAVERIGGFSGARVEPAIGAANPFYYRNKMQFPVGREKGRAIIGCFARGSHDIVETDDCLIQKKENNDIMRAMRGIINKLKIPVYDEDRHRGVLRHVIGRVGKTGEAMLILVTATKELPKEREIVSLARKALPFVRSIHQNIQTYRSNVIMGRETKLLWGRPTIKDSLGPLNFVISPRSFFQVHTEQAEVLYKKALEYAGLKGEEDVIDAYCGTGTITLFLARKAHQAYGIEIVRPAIEDAKKNARNNNIKNAEFYAGDATEVMPRLERHGITPDVIVVDPPRAGCTETVLMTFAKMHPARIVYVSCNPATLARDMKYLSEHGYIPKKIQPVDMFPQTSHVEVVVLMVNQGATN